MCFFIKSLKVHTVKVKGGVILIYLLTFSLLFLSSWYISNWMTKVFGDSLILESVKAKRLYHESSILFKDLAHQYAKFENLFKLLNNLKREFGVYPKDLWYSLRKKLYTQISREQKIERIFLTLFLEMMIVILSMSLIYLAQWWADLSFQLGHLLFSVSLAFICLLILYLYVKQRKLKTFRPYRFYFHEVTMCSIWVQADLGLEKLNQRIKALSEYMVPKSWCHFSQHFKDLLIKIKEQGTLPAYFEQDLLIELEDIFEAELEHFSAKLKIYKACYLLFVIAPLYFWGIFSMIHQMLEIS